MTWSHAAVLLVFAAVAPCSLAQPVHADDSAWEVTLAVRITEADDKPIEVHLALPSDTTHQRISEIAVVDRGLDSDIVLGAEPGVVFRGRVEDSRRVSASFRVDRSPRRSRLPAVRPAVDPPRAALDALRPATLFPSRSILVREFLETYATPKLQESDADMLRAIYAVIREQLPHNNEGKSLPLDVLRRGFGLRIGRERVLTTCLRSAGIPARFVEGIATSNSTRRKRVFWNEVWSNGQWYPVSMSRGWLGRIPDDVIALTFDGRPVLRSHGAGQVEYSVLVRPLSSPPPPNGAASDRGGDAP